jgi:hypothetical protein
LHRDTGHSAQNQHPGEYFKLGLSYCTFNFETMICIGHFRLLLVWICDELRTDFFKLPEETPGISAEIQGSSFSGH